MTTGMIFSSRLSIDSPKNVKAFETEISSIEILTLENCLSEISKNVLLWWFNSVIKLLLYCNLFVPLSSQSNALQNRSRTRLKCLWLCSFHQILVDQKIHKMKFVTFHLAIPNLFLETAGVVFSNTVSFGGFLSWKRGTRLRKVSKWSLHQNPGNPEFLKKVLTMIFWNFETQFATITFICLFKVLMDSFKFVRRGLIKNCFFCSSPQNPVQIFKNRTFYKNSLAFKLIFLRNYTPHNVHQNLIRKLFLLKTSSKQRNCVFVCCTSILMRWKLEKGS